VPLTAALFKSGLAPGIIVSGGFNSPPYALWASTLAEALIEQGVAPDRIAVDEASRNTAESARYVVERARSQKWTRVVLVTSAYHMPRAFLSVVKALGDTALHVVPAAVKADDAPWFTVLPGFDFATREILLDIEDDKITRYQASGDVASYEDGIAYLEKWEAK
jgi:uncharacterized SAM-binding protein YcdF (DUF218 family)